MSKPDYIPARPRCKATPMYRDYILAAIKPLGGVLRDVGEVEEGMRAVYGTLDALTTRQFNSAARKAYREYKEMEAEGWFK